MARACCLIRSSPHYRLNAFVSGLSRHFAQVHLREFEPAPGDCLVIWNRYGRYDNVARKFEAAGAWVLVVENGYIGKDEHGRQYYAIARNYHNGGGSWHVGGERRIQGVELLPWREDGREIVILPQRGIGCDPVRQPQSWLSVARSEQWEMPVRVRPHPGVNKCVPLLEDLSRAAYAVVWASGAGIKAICGGIPVVHYYHDWIGAPAAAMIGESLYRGDRGPMLHQLAWAQWTVDEIERGAPFEHLLH